MKTTYTLLSPGKAPFMTRYPVLDADTGEVLATRYFRLLGYDNGRGVYIRTSILGHRDSNTNTIFEYDITTNMIKSGKRTSIASNAILEKHINFNLFEKTLNRTDLIKEYDASSIVTEETIKETEKVKVSTRSLDTVKKVIKPYTIVKDLTRGGNKLLALTSKENEIKINADITVDEFYSYFVGGVEGVGSEQKSKVLEKLSEKGYTLERIKEKIQTIEQVIEFLYLHERNHVDNNDRDVYWEQGQNLLTDEVRATYTALEQMGNKEVITGKQLDLFDQEDPFKCKNQ